MDKEEFFRLFPLKFRNILPMYTIEWDKLTEIRMRAGKIMYLYEGEEERTKTKDGQEVIVSGTDIREIMDYITEFSAYAYEEEMRHGFLTINGGHRVGIVGKPVLEQGKIKSFQYITGLNFRFAHEIIGTAESMCPFLYSRNGIRNTLIISPPGFGKTTLLRDMIRYASEGFGEYPGVNIGVVDERSEIGGSVKGIPQNRLGPRTDLLDACPKVEGMMLLIRAMSPRVIAVDELGGNGDVYAVRQAIRCGCSIFATVHGADLEELSNRPDLKALLEERIFERYILIKRTGDHKRSYNIYNQKFDVIERLSE